MFSDIEKIANTIDSITIEACAAVTWNSLKLKKIISIALESQSIRAAIKEIDDVPLEVIVSKSLYLLNAEIKRKADETLIDLVNLFGHSMHGAKGSVTVFQQIEGKYEDLTDTFEGMAEEARFQGTQDNLCHIIGGLINKQKGDIRDHVTFKDSKESRLLHSSDDKKDSLITPRLGTKIDNLEEGLFQSQGFKIQKAETNHGSNKNRRNRHIEESNIIQPLEKRALCSSIRNFLEKTPDRKLMQLIKIEDIGYQKLGAPEQFTLRSYTTSLQGIQSIRLQEDGLLLISSKTGEIFVLSSTEDPNNSSQKMIISTLDVIKDFVLLSKNRLLFSQLQKGLFEITPCDDSPRFITEIYSNGDPNQPNLLVLSKTEILVRIDAYKLRCFVSVEDEFKVSNRYSLDCKERIAYFCSCLILGKTIVYILTDKAEFIYLDRTGSTITSEISLPQTGMPTFVTPALLTAMQVNKEGNILALCYSTTRDSSLAIYSISQTANKLILSQIWTKTFGLHEHLNSLLFLRSDQGLGSSQLYLCSASGRLHIFNIEAPNKRVTQLISDSFLVPGLQGGEALYRMVGDQDSVMVFSDGCKITQIIRKK